MTRIDLHTHSNRSDGSDTPTELVAKAVAVGLDVVALTDHDTVAGWAEAEAAARQHDLVLIKGMELSTRNQGVSQHLLAYGFDPAHPDVEQLRARSKGSRSERAEQMLERLAELGVPVERERVWQGVKAGGVPGRKHFAGALTAAGH